MMKSYLGIHSSPDDDFTRTVDRDIENFLILFIHSLTYEIHSLKMPIIVFNSKYKTNSTEKH